MSPRSANRGKRRPSSARERFESDTKRNGLARLERLYEEKCGILGEKHHLVVALRGKLARMRANFEMDRGMEEFRDLTYEVSLLLDGCNREQEDRERSREPS